MWWNNQVLSVLVGGKHTDTWRNNRCSWCEREQMQVQNFQVLRGVGWMMYTLVCAVCEQAHEGLGLIGGFSNISNVNSDESYCSWENVCTRVWSVFVKTHALVYLRWSRGPRHHQQTETHHPDMACIFYWTKQLCLNTPPLWAPTVYSWMCSCTFVWSDGLISALTVPFNSVLDSKEKTVCVHLNETAL